MLLFGWCVPRLPALCRVERGNLGHGVKWDTTGVNWDTILLICYIFAKSIDNKNLVRVVIFIYQ